MTAHVLGWGTVQWHVANSQREMKPALLHAVQQLACGSFGVEFISCGIELYSVWNWKAGIGMELDWFWTDVLSFCTELDCFRMEQLYD